MPLLSLLSEWTLGRTVTAPFCVGLKVTLKKPENPNPILSGPKTQTLPQLPLSSMTLGGQPCDNVLSSPP